MTTSDDERQHITTNDSKWQLQVAQRVTKGKQMRPSNGDEF